MLGAGSIQCIDTQQTLIKSWFNIGTICLVRDRQNKPYKVFYITLFSLESSIIEQSIQCEFLPKDLYNLPKWISTQLSTTYI